VASSNFMQKSYFGPLYFFGLQVIGFFIFQKFNFDIKVYFPRFHSFFFVKRERESRQISVKRKILIIDNDSNHQMVETSVIGFHLMSGILHRCFFFFYFPEKTNLIMRMFLDSGWFWFIKLFFSWFLEVMDRFIKMFKVFSKCFGLKMSF